ncbi:inorganic pyrophosphatase [Parasitella parasitica]|nr:inorganic pyrophosphatase [Parasitella parasitica]
MKFSTVSSTFVCSLFFGSMAPFVMATNNTADGITIRTIGAPNTVDYKVYYEKDGHAISAFHDIPLFANNEKTLYNMVVEIPRWTNAKNEINKETPLNPIIQDLLDGSPRFIPNIYPFKGYIWNYGAFPQTWEDPNFISPHTNMKGDNDPIDVIEIGSSVGTVGQIKQVKILGILGLLDQGETDWKVIVIDVNDPLFEDINDIEDVETYMPGYLKSTNTLFKVYKLPQGKKENQIAFDGEAKNKAFATDIVLETHHHWKLLINGTTPRQGIQTINLSVNESPYKCELSNVTVSSVPESNALPAADVPKEIDMWYYTSTLKNTLSTKENKDEDVRGE